MIRDHCNQLEGGVRLFHFTCNSTIDATLYRDWLQEMKFDTCSEKIISQISSINCHTKRWHNGVKHICRRISITYIPNMPLRNNAPEMWTKTFFSLTLLYLSLFFLVSSPRAMYILDVSSVTTNCFVFKNTLQENVVLKRLL